MTDPQPFDLTTATLEPGVTLIEASAGTGKTYALAGLFVRLLVETERRVGEILVVTFTNAATDELKTRIRARLRRSLRVVTGDESPAAGDALEAHLLTLDRERVRNALRRALLEFDDNAISTIHGFCQRVLEDSAFESGSPLTFALAPNDTPMLLRAAEDFWRRHLQDARPLIAAWIATNELTPARLLRETADDRAAVGRVTEPPPPNWDDAVAQAAAAADALRTTWDRDRVTRTLTDLKFKAKTKIPTAGVDEALACVDAFVGGSDPSGLELVLEFALPKLQETCFKRTPPPTDEPFFTACRDLATALTALEHALYATFSHEIDAEFRAEKLRLGVRSFDDLLRDVHRAVHDEHTGGDVVLSMRRRYGAVLVDEFQDTDIAQYEILRTVFRTDAHALYLIGDPKQAIYAFRGADVFAYLRAKADATTNYTLTHNWRSAPRLVEAVNTLFEGAARPFMTREIPFHPVAPAREAATLELDDAAPLRFLVADERSAALAAVVDDIVELLERKPQLRGGGELAPGNVAVLTRTNAEAQDMQSLLRRARVPSVIGKGGDLFESAELDEVVAIASAVANPGDVKRARAAWTTLTWGLDRDDLATLERDDERLQLELQQLDELRGVWLRDGFVRMVERVLDERSARARLLALDGGERRLTNVLHAVELMHAVSAERGLSPDGLLEWIGTERDERLLDFERRELRLESDADAVQILTIHRSKGLEFDVVYCPFVAGGRAVHGSRPAVFHRAEPDGSFVVVVDRHTDGTRERDVALPLAEAERLGEDLRLLYVALTRARERCTVCWGRLGERKHHIGYQASALAYLLRAHERADDGTHDDLTWARSWVDARVGGETKDPRVEILATLATDHPGRILVAPVDADDPTLAAPRWTGAPARRADAAARAFVADDDQLSAAAISSFTALVESIDDGSGALGAGPDVEADPTLDETTDVDPSIAAGAEPIVALAAFARGRRAGLCLHEVFENVDFTAAAEPAAAEQVTSSLRRHGLLDVSAHAGPLDPEAATLEMLRRVTDAPLPPELGLGDLRLRDVRSDRRLVEWQFFVDADASVAATAPSLAAAFEQLGTERSAPYATRVAELAADATFATLRGHLTGYVDAIVEHDGRFVVVDWKSNHLGDRATDYDPAALDEAMLEHHYVLQYHLYLVALQRHLRARLRDYDYDRHVAGALYVFLRGVDGDASHGLFADRPHRELIDRLDDLLGHRRRVDGGAA